MNTNQISQGIATHRIWYERAKRELVIANRILANEGVVDALGHVSVRNPLDPTHFFISRSLGPELVTSADIQEYGLDGVEVHRVTFAVGARWAHDLKASAGTESCLLPHVAYVHSGRLRVRMDDGSEEEFGPNDIMMLPPGHDAWTVGDEPCVFIEFSRGADYYQT